MAKLFANSKDPDQMPCSAVSDLGLHCLPATLLGDSRLQWVKRKEFAPAVSKFFTFIVDPFLEGACAESKQVVITVIFLVN